MYSQVSPSLIGNNWLNMDYQNEHTAAYPNGAYPHPQCGPEATFGNLSFDTNTISRDEKPLAMSSLGYAITPVDIGPTASVSVEPSFIPLAPEVGTQGVLDVSFNSSPVASSFRSNLALQQWWPERHSAHSLSREVSRSYTEIPSTEPYEFDYTLAESVDVKPFGHDGAFHLGELERRTIHRKHRSDSSAHRIEGQDTRFMCTVGNCGKNFSGEWEKTRHIKSMHCPPTIGCRKCNYKQSRKDLFSEHCKKRHPGDSIEELRVQLDVHDA